jgi:hypothetical protein
MKLLDTCNGSLNLVSYVKVFWAVISHLFVCSCVRCMTSCVIATYVCEIVTVPSQAYSVLDWITNISWINK